MQTINPYRFSLLLLLLICSFITGEAQIFNKIQAKKDSIAARIKRMPSIDSMAKRGSGILKAKKDSITADIHEKPSFDSMKRQAKNSIKEKRKEQKKLNALKSFHSSWEEGKVPDFTNAYTLNRHEIRLSLWGRSAYAFTDRFEVSSFLPALFLPNLSFKYRFIDKPHFASAFEIGGATGALPLAIASGLVLPGAVVGAGTAGVFRGRDISGKLHVTWRPGKKVAFSLRGGVSYFKIKYTGIIGGAGLGGNGAVIAFLPVDKNLIKATWLMAGFQVDYAINKRNILVLRGSINSITTPLSRSSDTGSNAGRNYLSYPSLSYTHSWNHFNLTVGIFDLYYPPAVKAAKGTGAITGSEYVNVYWVFNNGKRKKKL